MSKRNLLLVFIVAVIAGSSLFFMSLHKDKTATLPIKTPAATPQSDKPQIVSTKPDPLDETIIPASEPIEITFNRPLQNVPEFKIRFEPKPDYKVELSSDRKTAKIIFIKPLELGTSFTLYIKPDTKFDGVGDWKQDKTYRFRTVKYTGV